MMKLSILEGNNIMAEFIVELDRHMFTITPKIYNKMFDELSHKIRLIRVKYMTKYLKHDKFVETEESVIQIERDIIEEIRSYVIIELSYFNQCKGCNYYIRICK